MAPSLARAVMQRLPFARATTPLQAATYLLGISLFSISFLVFLNSSISFVITDRIGVKDGVGNIVGTLGFVDELVALVACPAWGLVSDRLGVRWVAVIGYAVIALALALSVQATNVFPQLMLARILFAVGATASATMVTAILPSLTDDSAADSVGTTSTDATAAAPARNPRDSTLSIESQLTITPERFAESLRARGASPAAHATANEEEGGEGEDCVANRNHNSGKPSKLAGFVGLFTGCGALVALTLFLPLPAKLSSGQGVTMADAVARSFYVVSVVALAVGAFVFVGLRHLRGEDGKGWHMLFNPASASASASGSAASRRDELVRMEEVMAEGPAEGAVSDGSLAYGRLLRDAIELGFTEPNITIGYLGGFVARASTVAISLFMPLHINAFFIGNGYCTGSPNDTSPELKEECRSAYVLAAILTGVAQLMGLLCAPVFGYLNSRPGRINMPIVVATSFGIVGYLVFPLLPSPEFANVDGRGGSPVVFLLATLIGISQIGAIVCSLGALGKGVLATDQPSVPSTPVLGSHAFDSAFDSATAPNYDDDAREGAPLLVHDARDSLDTQRAGDDSDEHADTIHELVASPRSAARSRAFSALTSSRPPSWGAPLGSASAAAAAVANANAVQSAAEQNASRIRLKGSVAGVYSWCGGAAILLLTKLGGYLFDHLSRGAPFYMMAIFNGVLLVASLSIDARRSLRKMKR